MRKRLLALIQYQDLVVSTTDSLKFQVLHRVACSQQYQPFRLQWLCYLSAVAYASHTLSQNTLHLAWSSYPFASNLSSAAHKRLFLLICARSSSQRRRHSPASIQGMESRQGYSCCIHLWLSYDSRENGILNGKGLQAAALIVFWQPWWPCLPLNGL